MLEHISYLQPTATTFSYGAATERSRERLDTLLLHVGDGENPAQFLDDVSARATQILSKHEKSSPDENAAHAVEQALRSAVLRSLREKAARELSRNATQKYPVFLVQVDRSQPGNIVTGAELTSFHH